MHPLRTSRREFLAAGATLTGSSIARASVPGEGGEAPAALLVNGLREPIGLGSPRPSLFWQLPSGCVQRGYRVLVASSPALLAQGGADLWDSGRVETDRSAGVCYAGKALVSRMQCHWKVMIWDATGRASPFSSASHWEMGLLEPDDWTGHWIAAETAEERKDRLAAPIWIEAATPALDASRSFRLPFRAEEGLLTVTLAMDGLPADWTLDGQPIAIPARDPNAFGGRPAMRCERPVSAGEHVLGIRLSPTPGFFAKPRVGLSGLLTIAERGGGVRRLGSGWEIEPLTKGVAWAPAAVAPRQPDFPWPPGPATLLRRAFRMEGRIASARFHVAALGAVRAWLNGTRVGTDELQSESSDYRVRIPSRCYDVTALVQDGANSLVLEVGDGWYASYQAPSGRYSFGPAPRRVRAQLELVSIDGERRILSGDALWQSATGAILNSTLYDGETQDLRLGRTGGTSLPADDDRWTAAGAAPMPPGRIVPREVPPIRTLRELAPMSVRRIGERLHLIDFGQNFAGRVWLRALGPSGREVRLRHAEILAANGGIDVRNLRAAQATDRYILAGSANGEVLEPAFTYHGFRYVEVGGLDALAIEDAKGIVLGSDLGETGTFRVDRPLVQKIWTNTLWSQRSNFMGIPTDCPQRDERLGWTADAQVFWDTAAFNMAIGPFTRGYTANLRDAQAANGAFPLWAPNRDGLGWETRSGTPGWSDAGVMLPYTGYLHTGDPLIVEENWEAMRRYLHGILATNPDGIWARDRGIDLGDWLSLDAKQPLDETTPRALIGTAMLARSVEQMARMAAWTDRPGEAAEWQGVYRKIRSAFAQAFVAADGRVGNGSHTSYILALHLGLVPADRRRMAADRLAADIRARGTLLSCGFLGTPLALDALADHGHADLAFDLLLREDYPSWGYMARHGATTMWERWNGDTGDVAMNSYNHYALGAVCSFLYRRIAGIAPVEPGCARLRVAPLSDPRFSSAGARYDSVRGRIEVDWRREAGQFQLALTLPGNTSADVLLPGWERSREIGPGTHRFSAAAG